MGANEVLSEQRKDHFRNLIASNVEVSESGCWIWTRSLSSAGYAQIKVAELGGLVLVHRLSHEVFTGDDLGDSVGMHCCNTPSCVNPDHIEAGTQSDNMRYAYELGRSKAPRNYGLRNGNAKLSDDDVAFIRSHEKFYGYRKYLAEMFNVSVLTIKAIIEGKRR